jgi:hypothetical protein
MTTTTSILEQEYMEPDRPYSQKELQFNRERVMKMLRVGTTRAHHKRCDHFYNVKIHGRKEKEIKEEKDCDVGNCSVCWKFNKTPRHLKTIARSLISAYCTDFYESSTYLSFDNVDIETTFYKWLYEEI